MGTGHSAHAFARALATVPGAHLAAVGSRSPARAEAFARTHGAATAHGSCTGPATDPGVDAVYVATPHPWHHTHALAALESGKHVLVRAPLAANDLQAAELIQAARDRDLLLMEGSAPRHVPVQRLARTMVEQGAIGAVLSVHAELGAGLDHDHAHPFFDAERGGGALSLLGTHLLSAATWYLGELTVLGAARQLAPGRTVDTLATVLARGGGGATATLTCASRPDVARAVITGSAGRIEIEGTGQATDAVLHRHGAAPERLHREEGADTHRFQALEFARCLNQGLTQSPLMPWSHSRALAQAVDRVRDVAELMDDPAHLTGAGRPTGSAGAAHAGGGRR
ncbi:Gfo/Idh/MocA family oxidoreductase [Nocardiopsis sp. HNM0947]|uniref:Gfo/Idh/MocA family oxidoreductase n=1 Tax=Nocardiopsis coralli TaxID=2772213 RepID=A0ABR9P6N1_9ACTN|nr:Gfo/Idh/MocA family oxidoreductase [Nocardiopsis coralli]